MYSFHFECFALHATFLIYFVLFLRKKKRKQINKALTCKMQHSFELEISRKKSLKVYTIVNRGEEGKFTYMYNLHSLVLYLATVCCKNVKGICRRTAIDTLKCLLAFLFVSSIYIVELLIFAMQRTKTNMHTFFYWSFH